MESFLKPRHSHQASSSRRWDIVRVILLMILAQSLWEAGKLQSTATLAEHSAACVTNNSTHIIMASPQAVVGSNNNTRDDRQCAYPNIMKHFDAMYIMLMPQRKQYMEQVVEYYGFSDCFDVIYVPAVHKNSIDKQWFQKKGFVAPHFKLGIGKIANHLTLLKTLRLFLYNSENSNGGDDDNKDHGWMESRCIILEDDIAMIETADEDPNSNKLLLEWWQHFSNIVGDMKQFLNDWDYVNLGRCYATCKSDDHVTTEIVHYNQAACTHAVGYSYAGALKAMQTYLPLADRSNDLMIADHIASGKFDGKAYQITPILFRQNETMGSILTEHGKSWKKPECTDDDNGNR
mmetsp:Transcript_38600/g.93322  ORF Transcript_38600/g.93322 Transcript_38600/m.93322 type:complete len:347 (+) Transcript_38600:249-1289(+)